MRRHASVWAVEVSLERNESRVPRVTDHLKATATSPQVGEGKLAPGGVLDHGTQEEDDPGTWEALVFLDTTRNHGESG